MESDSPPPPSFPPVLHVETTPHTQESRGLIAWVYLRFLLVHLCITGPAVRTDYKVDIGNRDPDDLRPSRGLSDAHIGGRGRLGLGSEG